MLSIPQAARDQAKSVPAGWVINLQWHHLIDSVQFFQGCLRMSPSDWAQLTLVVGRL